MRGRSSEPVGVQRPLRARQRRPRLQTPQPNQEPRIHHPPRPHGQLARLPPRRLRTHSTTNPRPRRLTNRSLLRDLLESNFHSKIGLFTRRVLEQSPEGVSRRCLDHAVPFRHADIVPHLSRRFAWADENARSSDVKNASAQAPVIRLGAEAFVFWEERSQPSHGTTQAGPGDFRDASRSECRPWPGRVGSVPSRRRIGVNEVTPDDARFSAEKHEKPRRGSRLDWARYQAELLTALYDHPLPSVKTRWCCRRYRSSILRGQFSSGSTSRPRSTWSCGDLSGVLSLGRLFGNPEHRPDL